jgi:beta-N-acetylhexosaminidase
MMRHRRRPVAGTLAVLMLSLTLACSGCGLVSGGPRIVGDGSPSAMSPRSYSPDPRPSLRQRQALSCPSQVFSQMTAAQRVGQLFLVGIAAEPVAEVAGTVAAYHFGSLLFGTTSLASLAEIRQVTSVDQSLASSRATTKARFFIAADQEGGEVQRLRGSGFQAIPSALAQGQLAPGTLRQQAAAWGRELNSAGVNLDLAPVMDVVPAGTASQNQPIGALMREFGYDPGTVSVHGTAFIRGMRQSGVATTAKHFPGLGRVLGNTDFTAGVVDPTTGPDDPYLASFQAAIDAGVPFVMVSLASYPRIDPDHLAVFSSRVMRVMLRQHMRFQGVIVSDDLGAAAAVAAMTPAARAIDFLAAGGDLITSVSLAAATAMYTAVLSRVDHDSAFRAEVNSAVMHILAAKQVYGLLSCGYVKTGASGSVGA